MLGELSGFPIHTVPAKIVRWTTSAFDALSRLITVTAPDDSIVSTNYHGNEVTVTDPMLKKRKSVTDALGRLKQVYEDPTGSSFLD